MYNGIYDKECFAYLYHPLERWIHLCLNGSGVGQQLSLAGVKYVAVYGVGGLGQMVISDLMNSGVSITCLIDRQASNYPRGFNGLPVLSIPDYAADRSGEIVLVTPEFAFRQISDDLIAAGVPADRIVSLAMALEGGGESHEHAMAGVTG